MECYEKISLKEIKKNYDYGDLCLLEYLKQFIPDSSDDELKKLYMDVLNYNEIYANGWTLNNLFKMGKEDKYWKDRAENFINKYNVSKAEYDEYSAFFDKYKQLLDELLMNLGIDNSILEMELDKIPEKGFIDIAVLTSTSDLDEENSFTVARVMNLCHCVELHYYKGKTTIEYGNKLKHDYWESEVDEVDWFNKRMTDDEVIDKLIDLFKDYFGVDEYVLFSDNDNKITNEL